MKTGAVRCCCDTTTAAAAAAAGAPPLLRGQITKVGGTRLLPAKNYDSAAGGAAGGMAIGCRRSIVNLAAVLLPVVVDCLASSCASAAAAAAAAAAGSTTGVEFAPGRWREGVMGAAASSSSLPSSSCAPSSSSLACRGFASFERKRCSEHVVDSNATKLPAVDDVDDDDDDDGSCEGRNRSFSDTGRSLRTRLEVCVEPRKNFTRQRANTGDIGLIHRSAAASPSLRTRQQQQQQVSENKDERRYMTAVRRIIQEANEQRTTATDLSSINNTRGISSISSISRPRRLTNENLRTSPPPPREKFLHCNRSGSGGSEAATVLPQITVGGVVGWNGGGVIGSGVSSSSSSSGVRSATSATSATSGRSTTTATTTTMMSGTKRRSVSGRSSCVSSSSSSSSVRSAEIDAHASGFIAKTCEAMGDASDVVEVLSLWNRSETSKLTVDEYKLFRQDPSTSNLNGGPLFYALVANSLLLLNSKLHKNYSKHSAIDAVRQLCEVFGRYYTHAGGGNGDNNNNNNLTTSASASAAAAARGGFSFSPKIVLERAKLALFNTLEFLKNELREPNEYCKLGDLLLIIKNSNYPKRKRFEAVDEFFNNKNYSQWKEQLEILLQIQITLEEEKSKRKKSTTTTATTTTTANVTRGIDGIKV